MNSYLLIAAALIFFLALIHSVLGEMKIFTKMKNSDTLPILKGFPLLRKSNDAAKRTLRMVWHLTAVLAFGLTGVLAQLAMLENLKDAEIMIIQIIATTMFVCSLVALILSRAAHVSWIAFLLIGILCLMGIK